MHISSYSWSFDNDVKPVASACAAMSYRVTFHRRPLWQRIIVRVLRLFGVEVFEWIFEVEVIE